MHQSLPAYYQSLYETTPGLTIEEMCREHNIDVAVLGDTSSWHKVLDSDSQNSELELIEPEVETTVTTKDLIEQTKTNIVNEALSRSRDADVLSMKDLAALTTLVSQIEASYKKAIDVNSITIMVQNIVHNYKDDC